MIRRLWGGISNLQLMVPLATLNIGIQEEGETTFLDPCLNAQ